MTDRTPTVAIAGFHHETNTFAPAKTPYEEFVKDDGWPGLVEGAAVIDALLPLNLGMGGFISEAQRKAWQLEPILWCNAEPYAHVTLDAYERIAGKIVSRVTDLVAGDNQLSGIYLCMHGAMVAEHSDDGEGELLERLRAVVGDALPIVLSLDLHANVTPRMFNLSDAMAIFRTYPHVDMAETGKRAFALLDRMFESGQKPQKSYRQVPFLLPLPSQYTGDTPCREIYQTVEALEGAGVYSVDFACGFPPADIPECGASAVAYADAFDDAERVVEKLNAQVIASESQFVAEILAPDAALKQARNIRAQVSSGSASGNKPVVIADIQDNPGAGGSGDTTGMLEALVRNQAHNAVLACIWDPDAAAKAVESGEGSELNLSIGGRNGPQGVHPYTANYRVERVTDGRFVCRGPMMAGTEVKLGPTVLLSVIDDESDVSVIVASERSQCLDQGFLRLVGIEPLEKDIICVKSTVHFRNDFDDIASAVLLAESPGANPCNLAEIPYLHLRDSVRLPGVVPA